jgi:hypothetical protein
VVKFCLFAGYEEVNDDESYDESCKIQRRDGMDMEIRCERHGDTEAQQIETILLEHTS